MTVSAQTTLNRSTGNGATTVFPYTFKIISASDLEVSVDGVVKTLNVDYTVSGVGSDSGGNVTFTVAPANGTTVARRRNMTLVRATDFQDQGTLPAATLDSDLDAAVLMIQQLQEQVDRSVKVSVAQNITPDQLIDSIVQAEITTTAAAAAADADATSAAASATTATNAKNAIANVNGIVKGDGAGNVAAAVAGTDYAAPGAVQSFTKAQRGAYVTLTDGATITPDFSLGNMYRVTLGGNRTLDVPTNLAEGQSGSIDIYQDSTGSRTLAYAWSWDFPLGVAPTLSTAARAKDKLVYQVDVARSSTVTITIATPGVVSWTAHGLQAGQQVRLTTTGALPTGLATATTYFVIPVDANSFQLAATQNGSAIATSGSQSGTHTMTAIAITAQLMSGVI